MQFSTGLLDSLFGEKLTVTLVGPDGQPMTRTVTKKWFEQLKASGMVELAAEGLVPVHMLGLGGYVLEHWKLGEDLDEETWKQFRDSETGAIYAMTHLEDGKPQTNILAHSMWVALKRDLDAIG